MAKRDSVTTIWCPLRCPRQSIPGPTEYSLHANAKNLSVDCPERDEQFTYIDCSKQEFLKRGQPIISIDTKKKELVGNFKNPGRVWSQLAIAVNDHDFRSQGIGMAVPFGIYDPVRNRGSVFVGTSRYS